MKDEILRLLRDPNLLPSEKQTLLSNIAAQAAAMDMPCYVVGGFVRDLLLGKPINDLDVIVEGDAIKFGKSLVKTFGGKLTTHDKFHTAIWHLPSTFNLQPSTLDLITARKETYLMPGALPTVTPSTIEDDLLAAATSPSTPWPSAWTVTTSANCSTPSMDKPTLKQA